MSKNVWVEKAEAKKAKIYTKEDGTVVFRGKLQEADKVNTQGRIYPYEVLQKAVNNYTAELNAARSATWAEDFAEALNIGKAKESIGHKTTEEVRQGGTYQAAATSTGKVDLVVDWGMPPKLDVTVTVTCPPRMEVNLDYPVPVEIKLTTPTQHSVTIATPAADLSFATLVSCSTFDTVSMNTSTVVSAPTTPVERWSPPKADEDYWMPIRPAKDVVKDEEYYKNRLLAAQKMPSKITSQDAEACRKVEAESGDSLATAATTERWLPPQSDEDYWLPTRMGKHEAVDLSAVVNTNGRYKEYQRMRLMEDAMIVYNLSRSPSKTDEAGYVSDVEYFKKKLFYAMRMPSKVTAKLASEDVSVARKIEAETGESMAEWKEVSLQKGTSLRFDPAQIIHLAVGEERRTFNANVDVKDTAVVITAMQKQFQEEKILAQMSSTQSTMEDMREANKMEAKAQESECWFAAKRQEGKNRHKIPSIDELLGNKVRVDQEAEDLEHVRRLAALVGWEIKPGPGVEAGSMTIASTQNCCEEGVCFPTLVA